MKTRLLVVLFIALFLNSCNKKSLPPKEEEPAPVFYFKCDMGGFPVDIKAGVNAYFMKSSYYQDSNNVYVFKGELKQKDCSNNCGFGLTVLINDYKASPTGNMYIDSSLTLSSYQYNDGNIEPMFYTCNFVARQSSQGASYNWSFSDGGLANSANITRTLKANTTYTASLLTTSTLYGSISHDNVYRVGNPVQTNINTIRVYPLNSVFNYKFTATNITGTPPFTYLWEFGDGNVSADASPMHEYLTSDVYTPKLTLVDANNDTCISYYQLPVFNGAFGESNFNAFFTPIQNTKALSTITILVNDQNGNIYSSHNLNQDAKSKFEIVSIENYIDSGTNLTLKKIKIKFNCFVYNGSNPLEIKNGEAVIAVAFKN